MKRARLMRTLILAFTAIPFLYPLVFMLFVAIRPSAEYRADPIGLPTQVTMEHFQEAWNQGNLGLAMVNSIVVATLATALTLVLSTTAAYWFVIHAGRIARLVLAVVVTSWVIPFVIYLLPLYTGLSSLGLINNLVAIAVIFAAINIPFGLYLALGYMRDNIPSEVYEAAEVDGAGTFRTFSSIVLPLSKPVLGALAALSFIWTWGDLLVSVVMLQEQARWTLPVAISSLASRQDAAIQNTAAAAFVAIIPLFLLFLGAQRYIVRGVTAGVGK